MLHIHACVCIHLHFSLCMLTCSLTYIHAYTYIYKCIYVYVCTCMCPYMCVYMYIYMHMCVPYISQNAPSPPCAQPQLSMCPQAVVTALKITNMADCFLFSYLGSLFLSTPILPAWWPSGTTLAFWNVHSDGFVFTLVKRSCSRQRGLQLQGWH